MRTQYLLILGLSLFVLKQGLGQQPLEQLKVKADSLYTIKSYADAAKYYEMASKLIADKSNLAFSLSFNAACTYALSNDTRKALTNLEKSYSLVSLRDLGPDRTSAIINDSDLTSLRGDPRFRKILDKYFPASIIEYCLNDEISFDVLRDVVLTYKWDATVIRRKTIYWKKEQKGYQFNHECISWPKELDGRTLIFEDCTFNLDFKFGCRSDSYLKSLTFERCVFQGSFQYSQNVDFSKSKPNLKTKDSNFEDDDFYSFKPVNLTTDFVFSGSKFNDDFWLVSNASNLIVNNCNFNLVYISLGGLTKSIELVRNNAIDSSDFRLICGYSETVKLDSNNFLKKNVSIANSRIDVLKIIESKFNNLSFENIRVESEFDLYNSHVSEKVLFGRSYFSSEPVNDIDFKMFVDGHMGVQSSVNAHRVNQNVNNSFFARTPISSLKYLSNAQPEAVTDEQSFRELLGQYSALLSLYKNKNDIESYNLCFITIKELQSERLAYLYKQNGGFKAFFRWKLSELLKFYVNYGTDPAQAIVISIYIIFCFGVFFFFFPSDWDSTSKKRMVENFREFVEKNEKGYIKPFFILLWGFLVSLINAITLSLNAFITLGFGNIPTHGVARYVCVIEGFLGWFLLSIFTVAMINQVL